MRSLGIRSYFASCAPGDYLGSWWKAALVWGVPVVLLFAGGFTGPTPRTALWTLGFAGIGAGCILNARGCGRLHCFFTGPFFVAAALVTLLFGTGVLPLGDAGWQWIAWISLAGGVLLMTVPEMIWGRYYDNGRPSGRHVNR